MKKLRTITSLLRPPRHSNRQYTAYAFGTQWTGALSRPTLEDEAAELTSTEILAGEIQNLVEMELPREDYNGESVTGSAGWGHSALIVKQYNDSSNSDNKSANQLGTSDNSQECTKLFICGRPHDFQTLMRLRRLPTPLRNLSLSAASTVQGESSEPSILQKLVSYFAGENEVTINEEECRKYSNVEKLIKMKLPHEEMPALEGGLVNDEVLNGHGRIKYMPDQDQRTYTKPYLNVFQNTLSTSAGLTAVISNTGTLYTFGLNQRGQCGVGSFSPNIWTPSPVVGLASLRFILDYNAMYQEETSNSTGSHVYKECKVQEYPMVSVALGLQHGIALDCMGQVFTWGKGERGQLGLGRRYLYESLEEDGVDVTQYKKDRSDELDHEEPHENKTLEYAMQVTNFYDPYATISAVTEEIYAPLLSLEDSKVRLVGAGMNFSLAVTESNLPYIWGKNCIHNPTYNGDSLNIRNKPVIDSTYPRYIKGLPQNVQIVKVACGTHHVSMLLEDGSVYAVGVATDQPVPMWNEAVEILPPNVVDVSSLISFNAGFDRTFVVYGDEFGTRQVIEIQLWSQEDMRLKGSVRPSWCDWLEEGEKKKVKSVHRGWMHSVVITEEG